MKLWIDFESRSFVNLKNSGLDNYVKDPSTEVLMLAWAFDEETPELWQPRLGPMPDRLRVALLDSSVTKCAWNYRFEKGILEHKLGILTAQGEWYDPSVTCAYLALPIGLDRAGNALDIDEKKIHTVGDNRLTKIFSSPSKSTKKMLKEGKPLWYFKDWDSHPEEWKQFCTYCVQDVIAERAVDHAT